MKAPVRISKPSPQIAFGTKAQTLERLAGAVTCATLLPQYYFTAGEWKSDPKKVIEALRSRGWLEKKLAVRSSALGEDTASESLAGKFLSVLHVEGQKAFEKAVADVIASYGDGNPSHHVLVQPMLADVSAAGVAFSIDPNGGGPYRVINYDISGETDGVTGGQKNPHASFYCHRNAPTLPQGFCGQVVALCDELERLLGTDRLDIEFAVDRSGALYLLQARPLVAAATPGDIAAHTETVALIAGKIAASSRPHPFLYGKRTVYGVMPDWNPAEIIGVRPNPLALSLYRELVTDAIWAYQRDNYGYYNLRSFPLLHDFAGLPYIDVRVSFNSFIPKTLASPLARKLVDYYIDRLIAEPSLHDKVEFEIVFSCYTLDLRERLKKLEQYGFTSSECDDIFTALTSLTNNIVNQDSGLWKKDIGKIEYLEHRQMLVNACASDSISYLYWLIEDCKRYGTLPFAGLARAGFIAVQLLQSFVSIGLIDKAEYTSFMASVDSVSSRMARDFHAMDKDEFLKEYGHLRPGTYDILSPRYDEAPDRYFDWSARTAGSHAPKPDIFALPIAKLRQLQDHINADGLQLNVLQLLEFIKTAIEAREYSKFVFTRNLSNFMRHLEELGQELGIAREDMAYASVRDVLALYSTSDSPKEVLEWSIRRGKEHFAMTRQLTLPPLVVSPGDAWAFSVPGSAPNFITQQRAEGRVVQVRGQEHAPLDGAIVFIPSADPGYDWIFSHRIKGLVTTYGGVNSHMAIRAGELRIPAVIGAGELWYSQWAGAELLSLDCLNRQVRVLR